MNKRGQAEILAVVVFVALLGMVVDKSLDITINKTREMKVPKVKISATELTKKNGKTIWCKIKGNTDCYNPIEE